MLSEAEVAPEILLKPLVAEVVLRCHCLMQPPVPPDTLEERVVELPGQMVPPPEADTLGSEVTVTVTTFETGSEQPDPVQLRRTR